jgi:hypothetical protein
MPIDVSKWERLRELVARYIETDVKIEETWIQMKTMDRKSKEYRRLRREYVKLWEQHRNLFNEVNEMLRDIKNDIMGFKDRLEGLKERYDIMIYGFKYDITDLPTINFYKIPEALNIPDPIDIVRHKPVTIKVRLLYFDPKDRPPEITYDVALDTILSLARDVKEIMIPHTIIIVEIDARPEHSKVGNVVYKSNLPIIKSINHVVVKPWAIIASISGAFVDVIVF